MLFRSHGKKACVMTRPLVADAGITQSDNQVRDGGSRRCFLGYFTKQVKNVCHDMQYAPSLNTTKSPCKLVARVPVTYYILFFLACQEISHKFPRARRAQAGTFLPVFGRGQAAFLPFFLRFYKKRPRSHKVYKKNLLSLEFFLQNPFQSKKNVI